MLHENNKHSIKIEMYLPDITTQEFNYLSFQYVKQSNHKIFQFQFSLHCLLYPESRYYKNVSKLCSKFISTKCHD